MVAEIYHVRRYLTPDEWEIIHSWVADYAAIDFGKRHALSSGTKIEVRGAGIFRLSITPNGEYKAKRVSNEPQPITPDRKYDYDFESSSG